MPSLAAELAAALVLLTRLPVARLGVRPDAAAFALAVWAYPLVGALVGAAGGLVARAATVLGLPSSLAAVGALAAMVLMTGALHEDGLADTVDGLGGGASAERRLAIMRDSRIGSFGAVALVLTLAARGTAIAALAGSAAPTGSVPALVAAGALGRAAMLVPLLLLAPARPDGLGASLRGVGGKRPGLGLAIAAVGAALLLPSAEALRATVAAAAVGLLMAWRARRALGGFTGDVLGATCVLAECAVLGALAARP